MDLKDMEVKAAGEAAEREEIAETESAAEREEIAETESAAEPEEIAEAESTVEREEIAGTDETGESMGVEAAAESTVKEEPFGAQEAIKLEASAGAGVSETKEAVGQPKTAEPEESKSGLNLDEASEKELRALKLWLFGENVRIEAEKKKLLEGRNRLLKERMQFQEEMKILNQKVTAARQRLRQDEQFFDKKMEILKNGFAQLDLDRKAFEQEKAAEKKKEEERQNEIFMEDMEIFYAGVKSQLALKKRYKDLLKIYHPDNVAGDKELMQKISREYERLKKMLS